MVNIRINEAETIFEPFYDGGDSYPGHEKYSVLTKYKITTTKGTVALVEQGWSAVQILIQSQKEKGYAVKIERDCHLNIEEYDILRLFAAIPNTVRIRLNCIIDGREMTVLEQSGYGDTGEYDGAIGGQCITHYSLEFDMYEGENANILLKWMGMSNKSRQKAMEEKKSPYTAKWEGYFLKEPQIRPMTGIFFSEEDLPNIRKRFNKEPFLTMTNQLRKRADTAMILDPEPYITDYVPRRDRRWGRDRDMKRPMFHEDMEILAFIGLLDERIDMLTMACRKMLSIAVTPYWTESIMGHLPGATWHHRSFTEDDICSAVAMVMDFAGSLLTWHGKNVVYDALIMKGLPRFLADFYTMDYIRDMNQGIVFNHGRILTLLTLRHKYPRYETMLQEAAKDNREMIDRYIMEDGGTIEGPTYWNYTFSHALITVALLARYEKKTLAEYAWDKLRKTGDFALAMISDAKDGTCMLPVNDSHMTRYSLLVCSIYKEISKNPKWEQLYYYAMTDNDGAQTDLATLLLTSDVTYKKEHTPLDTFKTLNHSGHTSLRRMTEDVGCVHCYLSGGPNFFAHCHGDKGQILLEVNKVPMLIDRGICAYSHPAVDILPKAELHNVFMPEASEGMRSFEQKFDGAGAKVIQASYEDGIFEYCTDTSLAWDPDVVKCMTRKVRSEDPHIYMIYDDAEFADVWAASLRFHTYGRVEKREDGWTITDSGYKIKVIPVNYQPEKVWFGENGIDGELEPVNSLIIYLPKGKEHHIVTKLEVSTA